MKLLDNTRCSAIYTDRGDISGVGNVSDVSNISDIDDVGNVDILYRSSYSGG